MKTVTTIGVIFLILQFIWIFVILTTHIGSVSIGEVCKICVTNGNQYPCDCEQNWKTDWDNPFNFMSTILATITITCFIIGMVED